MYGARRLYLFQLPFLVRLHSHIEYHSRLEHIYKVYKYLILIDFINVLVLMIM